MKENCEDFFNYAFPAGILTVYSHSFVFMSG